MPLIEWQSREQKQRVLSPSHIMVFLISVHIVLCCYKKSRHHLGTKVAKIIVVISMLMEEDVSIYNGFRRLIRFNGRD